MTEICENCGAEIKEGARFCQDCGAQIESPMLEDKYCPNCGANIANSENFCEECGFNLKTTESSESFIEKYKIPIIIGIVTIILILAGLLIMGSQSQDNTQIELPATTVTVGAEYFELPGQFALNPGPLDIDTNDGVVSFSQSFSDNYDVINIGVMSSGFDVDLESVIASQGGVKKTLMGYEGYYNEVDINDYSFSFILDGKICVIETTSPYLFDEITVL